MSGNVFFEIKQQCQTNNTVNILMVLYATGSSISCLTKAKITSI